MIYFDNSATTKPSAAVARMILSINLFSLCLPFRCDEHAPKLALRTVRVE